MCVNHPRFTRFYVWGQRYVEQAVGEIRVKQNSKAYGRTLIVGAGTGLDIPTLGPNVSGITLLEPDALNNLQEALELYFEDHDAPTGTTPIIAPVEVNVQ